MANWVSVRVNGVPYLPGLVLTGPLLLSGGTAAAPAATTGIDSLLPGFWWDGAGGMFFAVTASTRLKFGTGGLIFSSTRGVSWASGDAGSTSPDTFLYRGGAAATAQLGADAAGVVHQMLKGPDRITSAGVGGNLTIAGGRGFDTGLGGSLLFQTAPAAGAGVVGVLATRFSISPDGIPNMAVQTAFVASDKYLVISAAGDIHVSALGPAS